jgi:hypothetical protein
MALIPRGAINSQRTVQVAVVASFIGLAIVPVITVPAMLVAGFGWRGAPRWARMTFIIGAVLFAAYLITVKPGAPATPHG